MHADDGHGRLCPPWKRTGSTGCVCASTSLHTATGDNSAAGDCAAHQYPAGHSINVAQYDASEHNFADRHSSHDDSPEYHRANCKPADNNPSYHDRPYGKSSLGKFAFCKSPCGELVISEQAVSQSSFERHWHGES